MPYRRFQPSSLLQPTRRNKRVRSERTCGFYASSLSLGSPSDVRIVRVLLKEVVLAQTPGTQGMFPMFCPRALR
jgi:hypothetical protein